MTSILNVHIGNGWFVPVTPSGECAGTCYEGALGCVVELRNKTDSHRMALKIPRLLRDSLRENANVADLMQEEARIVYSLWRGKGIRGLMPASAFGGNPLAEPVIHDALRANGPPLEVQRSLVAVSFEKGKKPRFVALELREKNEIKLDEGLDQATREQLKALFTPTAVQQVLSLRYDPRRNEDQEDPRLGATVFLTGDGHDESNHRGPEALSRSIRMQPTGVTWYVFVPAVVYNWAKGTLQEHLSSTERKPWRVREHFEFFEQILSGLRSLHASNFLHADLRPANIMHLGKPSDPRDYYLIDYGSTAVDRVHAPISENPPHGGRTVETSMPGPVLGPFRSSPFYAPERRSATERETADCAVIVTLQERHLICLGWRKHLLEPGKLAANPDGSPASQTSDVAPKEEIVKLLVDSFKSDAGEFLQDPLGWPCPEDRLRIRDYIFEIKRAKIHQDMQLFECKENCYQVFHDRVSVKVHNDDEFGMHEREDLESEEDRKDLRHPPRAESSDAKRKRKRGVWWIPISRVVELYQVSEATDLYSFGAVCLYCLYRCAPASLGDTKGGSKRPPSNAALDADFDRMLATLADIGYFKHVWPYLDEICNALQVNFGAHPNADRAEIESRDISWHTREQASEAHWRSIHDHALAVTSMLCQTVEQARRILASLDNNVAHFLFLLHFILGCIHRRKTLFQDRTMTEDWAESKLPFADSRLPAKSAQLRERVAARATERLEWLRDNFNQVFFQHFVATQIPDYNPTSEWKIRLENARLTQGLSVVRSKVDLLPDVVLFPRWNPTIKRVRSELKALETAQRRPGGNGAEDHEPGGTHSASRDQETG